MHSAPLLLIGYIFTWKGLEIGHTVLDIVMKIMEVHRFFDQEEMRFFDFY